MSQTHCTRYQKRHNRHRNTLKNSFMNFNFKMIQEESIGNFISLQLYLGRRFTISLREHVLNITVKYVLHFTIKCLLHVTSIPNRTTFE